MGRYSRAALVWVATVSLAAVGLIASHLAAAPEIDLPYWLGLGLLALCAGVAHVFPIKSATDGASYRLTNVFVLAEAIVLPPALLGPLVVLAISPETLLRRRRPGALIRWAFNASQTAVAAYAANALASAIDAAELPLEGRFAAVVAMVAAAAAFTLLQGVLVAVVISLNSRIPLTRADTLTPTALSGDSFIAVQGMLVAGLWLTSPELLVLLPPILVLAHRLTRTAHLAQLAHVDVKTGLHNSRYFERALEEELAHSQRVRRPLAVLLADLDHFKRVNDTHGHAAGDRVLREIASVLAAGVRKGDIVARFGGEEFIALLPGTDAEEASYLAERLRGAVEDHAITLESGAELRCTVSIGVANYPDHAGDFASLVEQADAAMYRAKRTRNAVARAEALPPVPRLLRTGPTTEETAPPGAASSAVEATPRPSRAAGALLWGTAAAGAAAMACSLVAVHQAGAWLGLLPLLALGVAAEVLKVQVYQAGRQGISLSFTCAATMAALIVEPAAAPLVSLASALVHTGSSGVRRGRLQKALFNLANPTLSAGAAAAAYHLLAPSEPGISAHQLAASCLAVAAFYVVNVGLVFLMVSAHSGRSLRAVVRESAWFAPTNIMLGVTGAFLGMSYASIGVLGVAVFALPLLGMRFTLACVAGQTGRAIETLRTAKVEVERAHQEKEATLRKLIETVASVIDARDNSVSGHSRRVARFAVALGQELGLSQNQLALVHTAGLFHDLGKVAVPEHILHKPDGLTEGEYRIVQSHAAIGERLIADVPQLAEVARMVGEHHERYDGAGYPHGRHAAATSTGGRILAVADALESMLAQRPYSQAMELEAALAELGRCAGTQFDPAVVAAAHRAVAGLGAAYFTSPADHSETDRVIIERVSTDRIAARLLGVQAA